MFVEPLISSLAPNFSLPAIQSGHDAAKPVALTDYVGKWLLLIFYPRDFSFVCPTELTSFSHRVPDFHQRNCQLLGISSDPIELHGEWLRTSPADGGLGPIEFPLAADVDGEIARKYQVWSANEKISFRGTFLIDPAGVVQYSVVHNLAVGRSVDETLRVLDALQSGGLCPASWTSADGNLDLGNALTPGRVLGQYRIVDVLGEGSFGRVFKAWDSRLERPVALKVIRRQTRQSRDEFLREARAAAPLIHTNICTIYSMDEIDGLLVIAMELLEGQPLTAYLARESGVGHRLQIAAGIATGLAMAHSMKVVHGDLKPDNILVGDDFIPRILDFGLARKNSPALIGKLHGKGAVDASLADVVADGSLEKTVRMSIPAIGTDAGISGTPAYMAPERWMDPAASTAQDVYSLGLILFELMTGRRAFPEEDLQQLLLQVQDRQSPERLSAQLPASLGGLCAAMLSYEPALRPSAAIVRDRLLALATEFR